MVSGQYSDEFERIGFVEGHGNSNSPKNYSYVDSENSTGKLSRSYRLKQIDIDGKFEFLDVVSVETENLLSLPTEFALFQNYPNPFNPATKIQYSIPVAVLSSVEVQNVSLKVFDVLGREVATLVKQKQKPGNYEIIFDGSNLTSGVYFYRLQSGGASSGSAQGFIQTKKMLLLK